MKMLFKSGIKKSKLVFTIFFFVLPIFLFSSDLSKLQKEKQQYIEEITLTNRMLNEVKKSKRQTLQTINLLQHRIDLRNQLINNISEEINALEYTLKEKETVNTIMQSDYDMLKKEYAKILTQTYKSYRKSNNIVFILSADNFNQAYKRIQYLKLFSEYRKKQSIVIQEIRNIIVLEQEKLQQTLKEKEFLVDQKHEEREELRTEFREKDNVIERFQHREKELMQELNRKKLLTQRLEEEIEKIIEEEAKKSATKYLKLTPQEQLLAEGFDRNKGRLPWPTKRGVVVNGFGKHQHPVLKGVYIENNGVDISTVKGSSVRAIYEGVVSRVFSIPGANYTVIIRHGNYLSVYQNLINVRIVQGQRVSTKEIIADVYYNAEENISTLHFEVWNELEKLNPVQWLAGR